MAPENPYDAPVIPSLNSPGPTLDDHTEVALRSSASDLLMDDETNFGDIERVIGSGASELEAELLDIDPRALAKRLAAADSPTEDDVPSAVTAERRLAEDEPTLLGGPNLSIDPRELARQLAEQAKARLALDTPAKLEPQKLQEDPAALARRLAKEAKARLALTSPPEPEPEPVVEVVEVPEPAVEVADPVEVAKPVETPPKAPKKRKKRGRSLADRAPRKKAKRSAADALKALGATPGPAPERVSPPAPPVQARVDEPSLVPVDIPELKSPPQPEESTPVPELEAPPEEQPESHDEPTTPTYLDGLLELLPGAEILAERPVRRPNVFQALWQAHQTRAAKDGRLELVAAATLLLNRVESLAAGDLVGVRFSRDGTEWAAFVDKTNGLLLAIVARPEIYLAGLQ